MKKIALLITLLAACTAGFAQKHMVVNTEKIFKALPKYTETIKLIDDAAAQYQANIDATYAAIEKMYNEYQQQKGYLTESARRSREDAIITREKEVEKYQEEKFGQEGELMKRRIEMIKPIQDAVFAIINQYAQTNGYTLVLDVTGNPSVIFYSPSVDKTDEIIKLAQK